MAQHVLGAGSPADPGFCGFLYLLLAAKVN